MAKVGALERFFDTTAYGRFGVPYKFGERIYGYFRYGREESKLDNRRDTPLSRFGIYQRRTRYNRRILVRERYYIPSNPRTAPQTAVRNTFANGMSSWASLTQEQKNVYNTRAKEYYMHGVNLYMREWLRSH